MRGAGQVWLAVWLVVVCMVAGAVGTGEGGGAGAAGVRVVEGSDAGVGEFPAVVALLKDGATTCTGSILAPQLVLTAAHCTVGTSAGQWTVRAGSLLAVAGGQVVAVASVVEHPGYQSGVSNKDDVALMLLAEPLAFDSNVAALLLPTVAVPTPSDVTVAGFGGINADGTVLATQLQKATMSARPYSECLAISAEPGLSDVVCTVPVGGTDTCQGDSGSALLTGVPDSRLFFAAGVLSYGGASCGTFSVWMDTVAYTPWIEANGGVPAGSLLKFNPNGLTEAVFTTTLPSTSPSIVKIDGSVTATSTTSLVGPLTYVAATGSLTVDATFAVPSLLRIDDSGILVLKSGTATVGHLHMETQANLRIILSSGSPSSLTVTNTAGIAGTLDVVVQASYTPIVGVNFRVVSYTTHAGTFSTAQLVTTSQASRRALLQSDVTRVEVACSSAECVATLLGPAAPSPSSDTSPVVYIIAATVGVLALCAIILCIFFVCRNNSRSDLQKHQGERHYADVTRVNPADAAKVKHDDEEFAYGIHHTTPSSASASNARRDRARARYDDSPSWSPTQDYDSSDDSSSDVTSESAYSSVYGAYS